MEVSQYKMKVLLFPIYYENKQFATVNKHNKREM